MAARIWFCFIAALAIIATLKGSPNEKNAARLDSGKLTVEGNYVAGNNSTRLDSGEIIVHGTYIAVNEHPGGS